MSDASARRYARARLALALVRLVIGALYLSLLLVTGTASGIADAARAVTTAWPLQIALVAAVMGLGHVVLTAPLTWLGGFWLPRRFGLLHQALSAWLADRAKSLALGAVMGLVAVEAVYAALTYTAWWWLWAAGFFLVLYAAVAAVVPVWFLPLFYTLRPLDDRGLRARLIALSARLGVPVIDVMVADQSRKSRTANAAVVGLGRTRRVLLFDTLLQQFTAEEIESVLAHELGHHVHRDIMRGLLAQTVLSLVTFLIAEGVLNAGAQRLHLDGLADPAGLPWLALVLSAVALVMVPLGNTFSRVIERQADDFALRTTGDPGAFVGAMERLAGLNLAERRPHRLKEILLYSHPAIDRRIARARQDGAGAAAGHRAASV
jgi:STE24 endopeptidase